MYDEFDDYAYEDDSLMEEIDDILYDEEYERTLYEVNVCEINDYWQPFADGCCHLSFP